MSKSREFEFDWEITRDNRVDIELRVKGCISGRYYPATRLDPAEYPDVEVYSAIVTSYEDGRYPVGKELELTEEEEKNISDHMLERAHNDEEASREFAESHRGYHY